MATRYIPCFLCIGVLIFGQGCSSQVHTNDIASKDAAATDGLQVDGGNAQSDVHEHDTLSQDIQPDTAFKDVSSAKDQQGSDDLPSQDTDVLEIEDTQQKNDTNDEFADVLDIGEPDIDQEEDLGAFDVEWISDTNQDASPVDSFTDDVADDAISDLFVDDLVDTIPTDNQSPNDPWEIELLFENVEQPSGMGPMMQKTIVQIPEGTISVEAQIQVRGDLDNFPGAFMTFLAEDEGKLVQCGDVSGLPQKPNNILDETFRIAWPRPENLHPSSIFFPPTPPFDFQSLPCQQAFVGKSDVEIGMLGVGIFPPGQGQNQGAKACGGKGCSNDAIVKLRFIGGEALLCEPLTVTSCLCPGQENGEKICEADGSGYGPCSCPELEDIGMENDIVFEDAGPTPDNQTPGQPSATCDDPIPFIVGANNPIVEVTLPGTTAHQVWPGDLFNMACPTSKPPYCVETFYQMTVTDPGTVTIDVVGYNPPWEFDQYWIDIQKSCGFGGSLQCGKSYEGLVGEADAGDFIISLTHAPPEEIYIPDQDDWSFTLQVVWSP